MQRKVISVSFNKKEYKKLEEIKEFYNALLGLNLNHSFLIKSIIFNYNEIIKERSEKNV